MDWMIRWLQLSSNMINKVSVASRGVLCLSYSLWISNISLFTKVSHVLVFIPLCCIFVIPDLYLYLGLVILMSHSWSFLGCLLFHGLLNNRYALFSAIGWFHYFWVSHIYGWKIGKLDSAWKNCGFIVSRFVTFPHQLLVNQTLLLIGRGEIIDEFIIIHNPKL